MKQIYLLAAILSGFIGIGQGLPPNDACDIANSLFLNADGNCYQSYVIRQIYRPVGSVTDSIAVRQSGSWGVFGYIPPLRTHFSAGTGLSYNQSTGVYSLNATTSNVSEGSNLYFTNARARSAVSAGTGLSYNSTTGAFTNSSPDQTVTLTAGTGISVSGTYPSFTVTNSAPTVSRTINNNVSRSLNSNYTVSATRDCDVNYSINVSWTIQALLSGSATAFLEYSTNSGSSWITVSQVSKNIGLLTFSGADDLNLVGTIPLNALVRIRTASTNMTVTYTRGQEVLL